MDPELKEISDFASLELEELFDKVDTLKKEGLTTGEAAARRARHGPNVISLVRKDKSLRSLICGCCASPYGGQENLELTFYCSVIRHGKLARVPEQQLVYGDIVHGREGERIPADIRLVVASDLEIDNSPLTGESEPTRKHATIEKRGIMPLEARNLIFWGTYVERGSYEGVVIATGDKTAKGRIARLASTTETKKLSAADKSQLQRLTDRKVLVTNLEILARIRSLKRSDCVMLWDKTGVITENEIAVVRLFVDGKIWDAPVFLKEINREATSLLHIGSIKCSNAFFVKTPENMSKDVKSRQVSGNAVETALLKYFENISPSTESHRHYKILQRLPFHAARKFDAAVVANDDNPEQPPLLFMKGAAERVLDRCKWCLVEGKVIAYQEQKSTVLRSLDALTDEGMRVIAFAYKRLEDPKYQDFDWDEWEDPQEWSLNGLTFIGFVAFRTPIRSSVQRVIAKCQQNEIRCIMVTGDHAFTSEAIAKKCNIIRDGNKTQRDVEKECDRSETITYSDKRIDAVVWNGYAEKKDMVSALEKKDVIFTRMAPKQKLALTQYLKEQGNLVIAIGDGPNDVPMIKAADIGIAMGQSASDRTKSAADLIILDDNVEHLVHILVR
mmetsp:Transcript_27506/g.66903  ORF Transcript_27506/g.66903 Transcript_27506/m.66903 type:complete len:616 (-) Transcript_27506:100-1947(-)|eukprot:CAMPEP_0114501888 /NCGR_PEP_ID=MMETSP0109-20121206/8748_1 /TAXON_ID=29199 /ORGANISM="Chlorarachnion reptans, Strain CCCM449" /LENGTH=615 /DNA_ID=CAMNT_0001679667 /DNA_START=102 /DNA_END=1949 /DNA_ORIENTATION=+